MFQNNYFEIEKISFRNSFFLNIFFYFGIHVHFQNNRSRIVIFIFRSSQREKLHIYYTMESWTHGSARWVEGRCTLLKEGDKRNTT